MSSLDDIRKLSQGKFKSKVVELAEGVSVTVRELNQGERIALDNENFPVVRDRATGQIQADANPDGRNSLRWIAASTTPQIPVADAAGLHPSIIAALIEAVYEINGVTVKDPVKDAEKNS